MKICFLKKNIQKTNIVRKLCSIQPTTKTRLMALYPGQPFNQSQQVPETNIHSLTPYLCGLLFNILD